jgi:hypothetical protein
MKRLVLGVLTFSLILGLSGCSDDGSSDEKDNGIKQKSKLSIKKDNSIKKYSKLPIKKDLSYFETPQNIAGNIISRLNQIPLSSYEKGVEFGSNRNIRKERLYKEFNINKYIVSAVGKAQINAKEFNEFEIDDFEKKLKKEFAKSIQLIPDTYKNVDKHIRIINLNIPVTYSKKAKTVASVKITNLVPLEKLNYSKSMLQSDFIKEELNNKYISQYIIPSSKKTDFKIIIDYLNSYYGLKIEADANILNEIGKVNKGRDFITELTLHVFYSDDVYQNEREETTFVITSFKLKSSDKRFISNQYINLIDTSNSFGKTYFIENNDVDMYIKEDD